MEGIRHLIIRADQHGISTSFTKRILYHRLHNFTWRLQSVHVKISSMCASVCVLCCQCCWQSSLCFTGCFLQAPQKVIGGYGLIVPPQLLLWSDIHHTASQLHPGLSQCQQCEAGHTQMHKQKKKQQHNKLFLPDPFFMDHLIFCSCLITLKRLTR